MPSARAHGSVLSWLVQRRIGMPIPVVAGIQPMACHGGPVAASGSCIAPRRSAAARIAPHCCRSLPGATSERQPRRSSRQADARSRNVLRPSFSFVPAGQMSSGGVNRFAVFHWRAVWRCRSNWSSTASRVIVSASPGVRARNRDVKGCVMGARLIEPLYP